jgi:hypothetical protein
VKEAIYRQIFVTEFNLHFHQPLKDTRQKCDKFQMLLKCNPDDRTTAVQRELHLRKAEKVRDKTHNVTALASELRAVFTFDLQKTLIYPVVTASVAYYKRQLSVFNFGIHNMADHSAGMFMWNESVASRGANEIGSCLLKYVEQKVCTKQSDDKPSLIQSVTAFSDSCGGQNRNFKIVTLLCYLVQHYKVEVTLHFMQSGHSFLPNDADFGVIEKSKKTAGDIFLPVDWEKKVAKARRVKPFEVFSMRSGDFIDLTAIAKQVLVNRKKSIEGHTVSWLSIQTIQFSPDAPHMMKVQYVCDPEAA